MRVTPVVIAIADALVWTFSESGAVITPGNNCSAIDLHTVRCSPSTLPWLRGLNEASINVGDRDDAVSSSSDESAMRGSVLDVHGGAGDDRLVCPGAPNRAFSVMLLPRSDGAADESAARPARPLVWRPMVRHRRR